MSVYRSNLICKIVQKFQRVESAIFYKVFIFFLLRVVNEFVLKILHVFASLNVCVWIKIANNTVGRHIVYLTLPMDDPCWCLMSLNSKILIFLSFFFFDEKELLECLTKKERKKKGLWKNFYMFFWRHLWFPCHQSISIDQTCRSNMQVCSYFVIFFEYNWRQVPLHAM